MASLVAIIDGGAVLAIIIIQSRAKVISVAGLLLHVTCLVGTQV